MKESLTHIDLRRTGMLMSFLFFFVFHGFAQVNATIDSSTIKIGEQITYQIDVESDSTDLVVFPEGQTFVPLEMIESYKPDTTRKNDKYFLVKKYALTQFDSGTYTIPRQKVVIGDRTFFTDSLGVEVNDIAVDTTKQKLYGIKPIIEVDKSMGDWWKYLLMVLFILGIIGFLVYWFVWRKKPLTREEQIALLTPYERAKKALKDLDESAYLEKDEIKAYYSELTLIIRKYLDEKVYDHSLESTTVQLIDRLRLLKDANQLDLDKQTIHNIETILKRADLVKFAKAKPDKELAKLDRNTIDLEVDHVKESLPEPTEEERLADLKYREALAKKLKRRRIIITALIALLLAIGTFVGFSVHYGFDYVKDTILGHPTKKLLESREWVRSEYGAPPIIITTPIVLERETIDSLKMQESMAEMATFKYSGRDTPLDILLINTRFKSMPGGDPQNPGEEQASSSINLNQIAEQILQKLEGEGAQNIITRREQFITPNGQEGLKTFGTADFIDDKTNEVRKGNYIILGFTTENVLQQIILIWPEDDVYADQIIERVVSSIELLKLEEKDQ